MKGRKSRRQLMLLVFVIILLINYCGLMSSAQGLSQLQNIKTEYVCKSIDVRNSVSNFKKYLENCTVIEGYLRILLIDRAQPSDYANLTFPKLREITDYFLLFRVAGLKSLRHLFPNLSVIRGSNLFHNYAFVIFEMLDLQDIGLPKLTDIIRGGVRIEKNPKLCYVDTIDWDLIAKGAADTHFIKANSGENECPNSCPDQPGRRCPHSRKTAKKNALLCWSGYDCQIVCNDSCGGRACDDHFESCCHPECLGGCNGTSQADCYACRHVLFQGRCTQSCPDNTYEYTNRRCLTAAECMKMNYYDTTEDKSIFFKPFLGKCSSSCPNDYTEDPLNASLCVRCDGLCPKECPGRQITNIAEAQMLSGCTIIKGSLDIQIAGGKNVVKELEAHLDKIKEITDYLKVVRNVPLMSLNFLKSLEKIGGVKKHSDMYALYVLDNPNLEYLWDWKNRLTGLKIESGMVFFHYNPKLCIEKIEELENITNATKSSDNDVSPQSNGNRASCQVTELDLNITKTDVTMASIAWTNFLRGIVDSRSLLGYLISYKEAPNENVTLFDDHDACSTESWKVIDVGVDERSGHGDYEEGLIPNLKPYTKYAVYVKTYTVATEKKGGQSPIKYFMTRPTTPTPPVDVKVYSKLPNQLIVSWKPPKHPNGQITHYFVRGTRKADSQEFLDLRNYCTEPLTKVDTQGSSEIDKPKDVAGHSSDSTTVIPVDGKCCACPKDKKQLEEEDAERQYQIQFENFLHNTVYIKRPDDDSYINEIFIPTSDMSTERSLRAMALMKEEEFLYRSRRSTFERANLYSESANQGYRNQRKNKPNAIPSINSTLSTTTGALKVSGNESDRDKTRVSSIDRVKDVITNDSFEIWINSKDQLNTTIRPLKHFSEYSIEVVACQKMTSDNKTTCSGGAIVTARTKHSDKVDDIESSSVEAIVQNRTGNSVKIKWKIPIDPNGLILNFHIDIKKTGESETSHSNLQCVTHKEYLMKNGYIIQGLVPGNYSLRLRATSLAGPGEFTSPKYFFIPEPSANINLGLIIGISAVVIIGLLILSGVTVFYIRKRSSQVPDIMYASVNPEYLSNMYVADEWEIPREKISILKELGQGSFGMVYEGKAKDIIADLPFVRCAVKTVNETASLRERIEFLNEASVMKAFSCYHVVKLLGVVSKGQPTLVVMELMANGDLKTYLRSHRPDNDSNSGRQPPTLKRMLQMAIEIADGMAYLAEKKFVHRDLAARNCMVSEALTVKIGDFGMTRDIYETDYYRKGGKGLLPVRWMAPESLKDGVFTSQSDVWSYGIVLWEMATLASQPYQGLSNEQVLKYVIDGGIMEKPENCPERLYELMRGSFHYNPKFRPTFIELIQNLLPEANSNFCEVSFYSKDYKHERDSAGDQFNEHQEDGFDDNLMVDGFEDGYEEEASPSTPLKSPQEDTAKECDCAAKDDYDKSQNNKSSTYLKNFRLHNKLSNKHPPHYHHHHHHHRQPHSLLQSLPSPLPPVLLVGGTTNENGNKGISPNSSDGSKASACSANGSILNGHVGMPLSFSMATEC